MGIALFDNNYCWFAAEITQWLLNKAPGLQTLLIKTRQTSRQTTTFTRLAPAILAYFAGAAGATRPPPAPRLAKPQNHGSAKTIKVRFDRTNRARASPCGSMCAERDPRLPDRRWSR
jgi:hypothetical protein